MGDLRCHSVIREDVEVLYGSATLMLRETADSCVVFGYLEQMIPTLCFPSFGLLGICGFPGFLGTQVVLKVWGTKMLIFLYRIMHRNILIFHFYLF